MIIRVRRVREPRPRLPQSGVTLPIHFDEWAQDRLTPTETDSFSGLVTGLAGLKSTGPVRLKNSEPGSCPSTPGEAGEAGEPSKVGEVGETGDPCEVGGVGEPLEVGEVSEDGDRGIVLIDYDSEQHAW